MSSALEDVSLYISQSNGGNTVHPIKRESLKPQSVLSAKRRSEVFSPKSIAEIPE